MAGSTRNNINRQGAPIQLEMDPTGVFKAFAQGMVQLDGTINNHVLSLQPYRSKVLERYRALRPKMFDGMAHFWKEDSDFERWI